MLPDRIRPLTETVKECWLLCARQRQLSNAVSGCVSTTQLPFSWEAQSLIWLVLLIPLGHVALLLCVQYEHRLVWWLVLSFPIPQLAGHYISKTSVWVWVRVRCAILQLEARTMDSQLRSFATRVWTCQWFWRKKTGPGPQSPNKLEMECCTKEIAPWQDAVLDLDIQISVWFNLPTIFGFCLPPVPRFFICGEAGSLFNSTGLIEQFLAYDRRGHHGISWL